MTARRRDIADLPDWPRGLTREEAARFVGVTPGVFDWEVAQGMWPEPERRGPKGRWLVWDRALLEDRLDERGNRKAESQPASLGALGWGKSR